jgi:hypothetical protein
VAAELTDAKVLFQVAVEDHLRASRAGLPEIIRNFPARAD